MDLQRNTMAVLKCLCGALASTMLVWSCITTPTVREEGIEQEVSRDTAQGDFSIVGRSIPSDTNSEVYIRNFMVNIKEIEMAYKGTEDEQIPDYEFEREIEGNYAVILIAQGKPMEHKIGSGSLPVGTLEKMEFDIEKTSDGRDGLEGNSVYLSGTFRGQPFVWATDDDYHLELGTEKFHTSPITFTKEDNQLAIVFDMGFLEKRAEEYLARATDTEEGDIIRIEDERVMKDFLASVGIEKD